MNSPRATVGLASAAAVRRAPGDAGADRRDLETIGSARAHAGSEVARACESFVSSGVGKGGA